MSATLSGGDLLITYNDPGDLVADITSDGTDYTVTGTGLASKTFKIADVTGVISVADNAAQGGQQFKVLAGTALANPLQINANVEIATLTGGITATKAGDVLIGSAAITLANDISTAATSANIEFANPVTLAKNTTINAGAGAITFKGTVDGAFTLAANSTGATTFGGVVGGNKALVSLTTNAGGTASLKSVTTTGAQTYGDDTVTLDGTYTTTNSNVTVDKVTTLAGNTVVSTGTGNISFKGKVDGAFTLATNSTGATTFGGVTGGTTPLVSLATSVGGTVSLLSVTTAGAQTYNDDTVTLNGTYTTTTSNFTVDKVTTLTGNTVVSTGTGNIAFNGTVDGGFSLTANSTGTTTFGKSVGAATALASLATNDGGTTEIGTFAAADVAITTTAAAGVVFNDAVTLAKNTTIDTGVGAITFKSTVDGVFSLTANSTGTTTFGKSVGAATALASLATNDGGTTEIGTFAAADVAITTTAADGVVFGDAVRLAKNTTINAGAGAITFKSTVDGVFSLTANSTGTTTFGKSVGAATALASLATNDGGTTEIGTFAVADVVAIRTTAAAGVVFNDAVTLKKNTTITAATGIIDFKKTLDGGYTLTVADANDVLFRGKVGNATALAGITLQKADSVTSEDTITLDGTPALATDGITIAAGVSNVSLTKAGSTMRNFSGNGIRFQGGSTDTIISGFTIEANGGDGVRLGAGDYTGTVITANTIRDNGNPTTHEGNGILVEGSNLTIGWTAEAGAPNTVGNTITGNAGNGIEIKGAGAQNNTILSNSISLNGYTFSGMVVGDGIALVDGGNGALPAPRILGAVADTANDVIRVQVVVPAAGSYYVQLFANTPADERGIFPADRNGFEGRTFVGDAPTQAGSPVTAGKPAIAGTTVAGNTVAVIMIPAGRVPAGNWLTATATAVEGDVAGSTSGFSEAVQRASVPVLAVGSDGPTVWVPHYNYRALAGNVLRLGGLTVTEANRLVAMRGRQIFISANGRSDVATAVVASVRRIGRTAVTMTLRNIASPGGSLAGTAGRFEPGPLTLPAARLYDAATGSVVLDVGAERITAALQAAGVAPVAADAFTSRFQGGLRVASGDVDGDGFADLVTAPGISPARPAATFGNATRIITIYSGNQAAAWQTASLDVSNVFPGYSGGFQVTLGDVLPEAAGAGRVVELIVAGTGKVAVYQLTVSGPGSQPVIGQAPVAEWTARPGSSITGLAAGDFSAASSDLVLLATANAGGTTVRTFSLATGSFVAQNAFRVASYVEANPQRQLRDVFATGATLAVGDIDGAADGKPELLLAAGAQGLANFRVLANDLVATGSQAAINQALSIGSGFTQRSRSQFTIVNGRRVWQPAGGPDYFVGTVVQRTDAPVYVAVVNAFGRTAAGHVFAALGSPNATANEIRTLFWSALSNWQSGGAMGVQPAGQTRFPLGGGLRLG